MGRASENASHINGIRSRGTNDLASELDQHPDSLPSVAVVGLSFKFPDEATSLDSFWDMLIHARCASRDFPPDRMNIDAFHHPNGETSSFVSWAIDLHQQNFSPLLIILRLGFCRLIVA